MTIGLKDLFVAKITEGEEGAETYGTPRRLAKAISVGLSVKVAEGTLYADDGVDEVEREFSGGELKLGVNDLLPADLAELLGQELDEDNVVYANSADSAPYFAVGFRARKSGGKYKYLWLYKVKFAIPSEEYKTKGESIEFNTPEITGAIMARPDGFWKAEHVAIPTDAKAAAWFTKVHEKNAA